MKNRKKLGKIILFFLICLTALQINVCHADAAGANISIKADTNKIKKGDIFYLIITVESAEGMSGFEGYFSYNQSVMKYITGGTVSSGNDDEFSISDTNREDGSTELKYSIQFKARRAGSSTISLKSPYAVYSAEDSSKMPVASNVLNILVVTENLETTEVEESQTDVKENQTKKEDALEENQGKDMEPPDTPGEGGVEPPDTLGEGGMEPITTPKEDGIESPEKFEDGQIYPSEQPVSEEMDFLKDSREAQKEVSTNEKKDVTTTVIIFALIFAICLLVAIIIGLILIKKQTFEEEETWSLEELWEENQKEIPEEKAEDSIEAEESLEDIERRLEKKRYWLRK